MKSGQLFFRFRLQCFFAQGEKSPTICKVLLSPDTTEFSARQFASVSHFTRSIALQRVKRKQNLKIAQEMQELRSARFQDSNFEGKSYLLPQRPVGLRANT